MSRRAVDDDHFHDRCGLFGIFGHPEAARLTYLGLYALQHRGQESAGIVASDGERLRVEKGMGLVNDFFTDAKLEALPGDRAMGHVRYSTAGDTVAVNAQPILIECHRGPIALGHNGNIVNAAVLRQELESPGPSSSPPPTPRSSSTSTRAATARAWRTPSPPASPR
jgi:amidophosphoribosyltransferase